MGEQVIIGDGKYIIEGSDESDESDYLYLRFITEINKENPIDEAD